MMKTTDLQPALKAAVAAAREVGVLMRRNLHAAKKANEVKQHDIKLELDVRCQRLIEQRLRRAYPHVAMLGEEGNSGKPDADWRWVVDPIDGTVNFAYGIPHACVSIALQGRVLEGQAPSAESAGYGGFETVIGVIYDPFMDELWTAVRGQPARLNGRRISVSGRRELREAVLTLGFSKSRQTLQQMLPLFSRLVHRVRKIRIMGAAALGLTYVASGRMDVYFENGIRLWDIAAGALIVECAGGEFLCRRMKGEHVYGMIASNGLLGRKVQRIIGKR
jgi:myo-inositol-1(or 4)-monophosphatase